MKTFDRVFEPDFEEVFRKDHPLKGNWKVEVFENENPITLELGCGKGEYSVSLARKYPDRNYIGIDIKGARMWKGAKEANDQSLKNVAFLRTRIEMINSFFAPGEVSEIWITFPDPQIKKRRIKKRLTSSGLLNQYRSILVNNGVVHLKTDSDELFAYTMELAKLNKFEILNSSVDVHHSDLPDDIRNIRTFYESQFLEKGSNINYIAFRLPREKQVSEPPEDE